MTDVLFVALTVAFFGLCVAYVRACDRIVSGSEAPGPDSSSDLDLESTTSQR